MLVGLRLNFCLGPHICWRSGKEPARQGGGCKRHEFSPWVRKIPGGGNGNPLQPTCLENPMDRGTWQATVHGVSKSQTWLKSCTHKHTYSYTHTHTHHMLGGDLIASLGTGWGRAENTAFIPQFHLPSPTSHCQAHSYLLQTLKPLWLISPDSACCHEQKELHQEMECILLTSRSTSSENLKWLGQHGIETPQL